LTRNYGKAGRARHSAQSVYVDLAIERAQSEVGVAVKLATRLLAVAEMVFRGGVAPPGPVTVTVML
jgi:hypothetical protein